VTMCEETLLKKKKRERCQRTQTTRNALNFQLASRIKCLSAAISSRENFYFQYYFDVTRCHINVIYFKNS
jgi:hypothetical protein